MNNIFEPLRLAKGSHKAGSGKGCAMNVISWENGDKTITDFPACSDYALSRMVQVLNDYLAGSDGFLSAENSLLVLELGHATVGTAYHNLSDRDLKKVYVKLAIFSARKVLPLAKTTTAKRAIQSAEAWLANETGDAAAAAYAAAAYAAYYAASDAAYAAYYATYAANAANAASYAAYAAYAANAAAASAAADAASAASAAADAAGYAAADVGFRVELIADMIQLFKDLTGVDSEAVSPQITEQAIRNLQKVSV